MLCLVHHFIRALSSSSILWSGVLCPFWQKTIHITHHNTSQYTSHSYYNVTSSTHSRYEDDTLELSILYKQNIWKLSFQECFHCIVETISKIAVAHVVNVFESLKFQFGTHLIISLCSNLKQNGVVATFYVVMLELRWKLVKSKVLIFIGFSTLNCKSNSHSTLSLSLLLSKACLFVCHLTPLTNQLLSGHFPISKPRSRPESQRGTEVQLFPSSSEVQLFPSSSESPGCDWWRPQC